MVVFGKLRLTLIMALAERTEQTTGYLATKTRRIMFTVNLNNVNPTWEMPECAYFKRWVYQHEKGTHDHIQGYVELTQDRRLSWFRNYLEEKTGYIAHLEKAREGAATCYKYCTKEETRQEDPVQFGDWESIGTTQGRRSDLLELYAELKKPEKTRAEIYEMFPASSIRYKRNIDQLYEVWHDQPRDMVEGEFLWFCGPSGTGKSWAAAHSAPASKIFYKDVEGDKNVWWDGYEPMIHEMVILEDYDGHGVSYRQLLRIADKYPVPGQVKGGYKQLRFHKMIVTSNKWPWEIFPKLENDPQNNNAGEVTPLMRRFEFWEFKKPRARSLYWKNPKEEPVREDLVIDLTQ